jgi:Dna[CI] antecedent, DciA
MALKTFRRTPKGYDGTTVTTHRISELLPQVLSAIGGVHSARPDLILVAWPEVIGPKLASMTEAVSFQNGILVVRVKNSTLYSLLQQYDKMRILNNLKAKFPQVEFKAISFRIR